MKHLSKGGSIFALFFLFFLFRAGAAFSASESSRRGDFDIASGGIKVTLHQEIGTFTFYKLRETGKNRYDPLLDTRNYGAGTCFSVSVNGRTHVLEKKAFSRVEFEVSEDGKEAFFVFTPSDDFQARQRFAIEENSVFGRLSSVLAIEVAVENTSGKDISVAWRAVFDTMLGERRSSSGGHFSTDNGRIITSETLAIPSAWSPKVLFSSDGERTCAFSLSGDPHGAIPDSVYIANWNRCDSLLRASFGRSIDCTEGRSLSSIYSPNDSAVLMSWSEITLRPWETASVTVFLSALDPQSLDSAASGDSGLRSSSLADSSRESQGNDSHDISDEERLFREKQALYFSVSDRLRQIEEGDAAVGAGEIDELNRILDFLLENEE